MAAINLLICAALLCLASQTLATQQCNLYNFGTQGVAQCGLGWWRKYDLGEQVRATYKISDIAEEVIIKMGKTPVDINNDLRDKIMVPRVTDPLGKIIESALIVEPYITYIVSDFILGMEITGEELKRFGIPEALADRQNLITLFKDYMKEGCSFFGVRTMTSCMNRWIDGNCDRIQDKTQVLKDYLRNLRDTYCKPASTLVNTELLQKMTTDLGTVFKSIPAFFGVVKDPASPYLLKMRNDSLAIDQNVWLQIAKLIQKECSYVVLGLTADLPLIMGVNATIGAGEVMETLLRVMKPAAQCEFRVVKKVMPQIYEQNKKAIEHLELIGKRYGFPAITYSETDVATEERHTVSVYGDPHMVPYKSTKTVTCSAIGQKVYIVNEFFTLHGFAEPVSMGSQATYVISVRLTFTNWDVPIKYESAAGKLSSFLTVYGINGTVRVAEYDNITISSFGDRVQIVDLKSGAVFGFRKYRETYYFTVRAGAKVLDGSLGLLITGCPSPVAINKGRRRRSTECDAACATVPADYRDDCNYDCVETGDTGVANISQGIVSLKNQVEEQDVEILKMLGVTPQSTITSQSTTTLQPATTPKPTSTPKPKDSDGGGDACQHLPSLMLVLILSFLVRHL